MSMGQRGFTLIELLIAIGVMGILTAVATAQFGTMQRKGAIERQVVTIYSNLVDVRLQALYTKTARTVVVSGKKLNIYPTADTSGAPSSVVELPFPVVMGTGIDRVKFDASGMMLDAESSICVQPDGVANNPGNTDSVVISAAKIHMGKRQSGGACDPDDIDQK